MISSLDILLIINFHDFNNFLFKLFLFQLIIGINLHPLLKILINQSKRQFQ